MIEDEGAPNFDREITNENLLSRHQNAYMIRVPLLKKATGIICVCVCVKSEEEHQREKNPYARLCLHATISAMHFRFFM